MLGACVQPIFTKTGQKPGKNPETEQTSLQHGGGENHPFGTSEILQKQSMTFGIQKNASEPPKCREKRFEHRQCAMSGNFGFPNRCPPALALPGRLSGCNIKLGT